MRNEIVATAPGRCGIVGNPTDMYGGSVLSISTTERARCTIRGSDSLVIRSAGKTGGDVELQGDELDIPRAVLKWFDVTPAMEMTLDTEIPMQAGMAGSTALVVACVGALARWLGREMNPWEIAEAARKIEYRVMGVMCGFQDQHMAVFGGLNFMDFAGKESLEQRDEEPLATIEQLSGYAPRPPLIAAHTGIQHHSGTVHKSPRERWLAGDPQVRNAYQEIAQLARKAKRALLSADWPTLGALMNENHRLVAELGGSGPENDRLIEVARKAGAHGAKLAGAGGGGTILALADDIDRVGSALLNAGAERLIIPKPSPGLTVL